MRAKSVATASLLAVIALVIIAVNLDVMINWRLARGGTKASSGDIDMSTTEVPMDAIGLGNNSNKQAIAVRSLAMRQVQVDEEGGNITLALTRVIIRDVLSASSSRCKIRGISVSRWSHTSPSTIKSRDMLVRELALQPDEIFPRHRNATFNTREISGGISIYLRGWYLGVLKPEHDAHASREIGAIWDHLAFPRLVAVLTRGRDIILPMHQDA